MNLKSKIEYRKSRRSRGVTIIEVLFAILITTVGLLGAIALFPVASAQARRARLNDMVGNAGRSAFHDFDARGMRRPDRWLAWDQVAGAFVSALSVSNVQIAESYCIDPRMIAAHTTTSTSGPTAGRQYLTTSSATGTSGGYCVQTFPYLEPFVDSNLNSFWLAPEAFTDLNNNGTHDPGQFGPFASNVNNSGGFTFDSSLMRRITLWDGVPGSLRTGSFRWGMTLPQANTIFEIDDDLSYTRPDGNPDANGQPTSKSDAAKQNASLLTTGYTNSWGRRHADGKITWIATIVPEFDVSGVAEDQYTLSIVMIYDRPNRLDLLDNKLERVVGARWLDAYASTGGEVYLTSMDPEQLKIRPNDWVMVSGSYDYMHTGSGPYVTRFQWYRVAECDHEPAYVSNTNGSYYELYATLMGQDWNTNFVIPPALAAPVPVALPAGTITYPIRVTIVEGAFAVYEKTIRLEYGSTF